MSATQQTDGTEAGVQRHPLVRRIGHWLQAIGTIVMIGSGWRIYNWEPVIEFLRFPVWATLGGERTASQAWNNEEGLANALLWHFSGMWVLILGTVLLVANGFVTGHFQRQWWPIRPREVWRDFLAAITFKLDHTLGVYNAVQKLLYAGVILALLLMFVTGAAFWKPVQFWWITALFGGFEGVRIAHFLGMVAIFGFTVVHVALVILVPKTLVAMVTGEAKDTHHAPKLEAAE